MRTDNNLNNLATRVFHVYMEPLKAVTTARPVRPPLRSPELSEETP